VKSIGENNNSNNTDTTFIVPLIENFSADKATKNRSKNFLLPQNPANEHPWQPDYVVPR